MTRDRGMRWTGHGLLALFALFMAGASVAPKLLGMPVAAQTLEALGWPGAAALPIGILELTLLVLVLVPRTAVLGAVLMTALLGGAVATQVRVGSPLLSHQLFGVWLGLVMWGGLWLRDPAMRRLFPWRRPPAGVGDPAGQTFVRERIAADRVPSSR